MSGNATFDLKQKVALITGASRGLGWAMAQSLASAGAHVVLNARDGAALDTRVAELRAQGLSGEAAAFDVNDAAAAAACVAGIALRHGRFDILVANAGIIHRAPIALSSAPTLSASSARTSPRYGCCASRRRRKWFPAAPAASS